MAPAAPAVTVVDPAAYANSGVTPQAAAPSLSSLLSTPSAQPAAPVSPQPVSPSLDPTLAGLSTAAPAQAPSEPAAAPSIPGLSIGTEIPSMTPPSSVPGTASVQGIDMSSVDSILNSTAQPAAPQSAPGIGDLSAILNSTVV